MVNEKDVMRKLKYFAGIAAALMLWGCSEGNRRVDYR